MKNPFPPAAKKLKATKERVKAKYRENPDEFMMNAVYWTGLTLMVIGGVQQVSNAYASYRSRTAYAKIMERSLKQKGR